MDITTIANIATILSLPVSILAILLSLKVKQDYGKFKIKNQGIIGNMGTISGGTVNFIMGQSNVGNAMLSQTQSQADETKNSFTVSSS